MRKVLMLCIVLLVLMSGVANAAFSFDTDSDESPASGNVGMSLPDDVVLSELRRMTDTIESQKNLCDKSIVEYRAEAIREEAAQELKLRREVESLLKNQRMLIVLACILSSFLGATLAISLVLKSFRKKDERFRDDMKEILVKMNDVVNGHHEIHITQKKGGKR